jgi:enoyl-CoA hydratase/carnithine racemase
MTTAAFGDVTAEEGDDHVAVVTIHRPPDNFFDQALIASLADAMEDLGVEGRSRAVVLAAEGKNFCAGASLGGRSRLASSSSTSLEPDPEPEPRHLYDEAVRVFAAALPIVAAVRGAAVGGGLGLALAADFRVGSPDTRMSANFARLGFHHGFGLTVTLPAVVGQQRALELLYTSVRLKGEEAAEIGLLDRLVAADEVEAEARRLAAEIAASGPLAVASIRATMRGDLPERIRVATEREKAEQDRLRHTADFAEGVRAMAERRQPRFEGR